jgi:hypothetical protein
MRTLAILMNLALLALAGCLMTGGNFELNSNEAPLFVLMLVAPTVSIVSLLLQGSANCQRRNESGGKPPV